MSIDQEDILRYLDRASTQEFAEIIAKLRQRLGLEPPRERYVSIGGAMPTPGPWEPETSVRLLSAGPDKIAIMKALRSLHEGKLGLAEVKDLVDAAPVTLWSRCLTIAEGRRIAAALTAAGAQVELF